jgi:hypothetical protein
MLIMQIIVIATFALDRAMLAGFAVHGVSSLYSTRRVNAYLFTSILLLALGLWLQRG